MNTQNKLQAYVGWCGICMLLLLFILTPLQNSDALQNGVTVSKTFFFSEGVILLLLIGSVIWLCRDKHIQISLSRIDGIFTLLVLYIALRSGGRITPRLIELIALTGFYLVLRRCKWRHFLFILYAIAVAGIIQSVYGLLQLYNILPAHSQFRLTGTFFNLGAYAAFVALSACVSLVLIFYFKDKRMSMIPQLNIVLAIIILPITQNRAAWIALIVVGVFLYARFMKKYLLYGMLIITGVLVIAGGYYLKKDSADGRVLIWKVTSQIVGAHPLTGIGYDRFAGEYMNYQASYMQAQGSPGEKQLADNVYYAFNDLLQLTAESGVIGAFGILLLILVCFRVKGYDRFRYAGQAIILGYMLIGMFYYPHFILPLKMTGVLGLAMLSRMDIAVTRQLDIVRMPKILVVTITLILSVAGILIAEQLKTGYKQWGKAQVAYQHQRLDESIRYFDQALSYLPQEGELMSAAGKAYFLADSLEKAVQYLTQSKAFLNNTVIETTLGDISVQQHNYVAAERYYQQALHMVPNRFYTEYMLLKLYVASNESEKACTRANLILHKEVKVSSTAVQQIQDSARVYYANNKCH
ncbi:O-antigen ligase family protein [Chitinophaga pinensis]|uniref:O-antigen polymerase n=1 Tax=Chitinophaga pinensis (strain ATCC 43595 / DSM 2588 / LMG 13176 / NBRC 15968 / NCIMB 11800 / UQM 2034) TaxID=485918 RepID=A0A979G390_CHIPD|nr:O-antigen ligase family protein [Chitinophaga pinensis]ACU59949.1 O-antigen polymerase [Chitinophaga pinensis DSM 2588]